MGVEHFGRITAGDYSKIQECFDGFPWSLSEGGSGTIDKDRSQNSFYSDGEEDDQDDKYEGDESEDEADCS